MHFALQIWFRYTVVGVSNCMFIVYIALPKRAFQMSYLVFRVRFKLMICVIFLFQTSCGGSYFKHENVSINHCYHKKNCVGKLVIVFAKYS